MEVDLGRYIYKVLAGNDAEILLCMLIASYFRGVIFRSKRSYAYSGIRSIECTLSLLIKLEVHLTAIIYA